MRRSQSSDKPGSPVACNMGHRPFLITICSLLLASSMAVGHDTMSSEDYWNTIFPNTPMPKALRDQLNPSDKEQSQPVNHEAVPYMYHYNAKKESQPATDDAVSFNYLYNAKKESQPATYDGVRFHYRYNAKKESQPVRYDGVRFEYRYNTGKELQIPSRKPGFPTPSSDSDSAGEEERKHAKEENTQSVSIPILYSLDAKKLKGGSSVPDTDDGVPFNYLFNSKKESQPATDDGVPVPFNYLYNSKKESQPATDDGVPVPFNYLYNAKKESQLVNYDGVRFDYRYNAKKESQPVSYDGVRFQYRYNTGKELRIRSRKSGFPTPSSESDSAGEEERKHAKEENTQSVPDTSAAASAMKSNSATVNKPGSPLFFLQRDMQPGAVVSLSFKPPFSGGHFLPPAAAKSLAFSSAKLPEIVSLLSIQPNSPEARSMERVHRLCEDPSSHLVEKKSCVTTLESMADFISSNLGTRDVKTLSTPAVDGGAKTMAESPHQRYTMLSATPVHMEGPTLVVCHLLPYPYTVYQCHVIPDTVPYTIRLAREDGGMVEAAAICHDTSTWNENSRALQVLRVKPGEANVCHFLPLGDMAWMPIKSTESTSQTS